MMRAVPQVMMAFLIGAAVMGAAQPRPRYVSPDPSPAEYGHGLTAEQARDGWISLFDGRTSFGWADSVVRDGALVGGSTSTWFGSIEFEADVIAGGEITCGTSRVSARPGPLSIRIDNPTPSKIRLGPGVALRRTVIRPLGGAPIDLADAQNRKVIPHRTLPANRQAAWTAAAGHGALRAVGGPGSVELPGLYGDFALQVTIHCRQPLTNAGVFFRSRPGEFLNGYEAQVFNGCLDGDPARPARYATGAIDDRQNARRLVSRDGEPFCLTIIATGPHIATWVNGALVTDWTDARPDHDSPRQGRRDGPGTIQLQAHDKGTDVEFSNLRIVPLDAHP